MPSETSASTTTNQNQSKTVNSPSPTTEDFKTEINTTNENRDSGETENCDALGAPNTCDNVPMDVEDGTLGQQQLQEKPQQKLSQQQPNENPKTDVGNGDKSTGDPVKTKRVHNSQPDATR